MVITKSLLTDILTLIAMILSFCLTYRKRRNVLFSLVFGAFIFSLAMIAVYIILPIDFSIKPQGPLSFSENFSFLGYDSNIMFTNFIKSLFPENTLSPLIIFMLFAFFTCMLFHRKLKIFQFIIIFLSMVFFEIAYVCVTNMYIYQAINKQINLFEIVWGIFGYFAGILLCFIFSRLNKDIFEKIYKVNKRAGKFETLDEL